MACSRCSYRKLHTVLTSRERFSAFGIDNVSLECLTLKYNVSCFRLLSAFDAKYSTLMENMKWSPMIFGVAESLFLLLSVTMLAVSLSSRLYFFSFLARYATDCAVQKPYRLSK